MTTIHQLSHATPLSEFDIFSVPPTQLSVSYDLETEQRPCVPMTNDRIVQFDFITAPNEYIRWSETELYMKLRFLLNPIAADYVLTMEDWAAVEPKTNFMHSMIQTINLTINGRPITKAGLTYAYRAYFDMLIGYTGEAKKGHLSSVLWQDPTTTRFSYATRADGKMEFGPWFELRGKLCLDIAQQGRAMLGGLHYKMDIRFNKPPFALSNSKPEILTPDWEISNIALVLHRSIVSPGTLTAHNRALQHSTAKYPITRHEVRTLAIQQGMSDVITEQIFNGQLPRRVMVGFVKDLAFRGDFGLTPYKFEDFSINYLSFTINGQTYPTSPYMPDFTHKLYMREYYGFLQAFNQDGNSPTLRMSYDDYLAGRVLFAYNFAPDLGDGFGFGGHLSLIKTGSLGMHMRFETPPTQPFTAVLFAEFDNMIEIDKNLQVTTDYVI